MTTSTTTTRRPADQAPPRYPMRRGCPFDPPAELRRLREERPISRVRLWDGSTPWLVTRYEDVRAVLADRRFSSDSSRPGYPANSPGVQVTRRQTPSFIAMDDPEHARYRKMLIGDFTVRRTEALRPAIERMVDELLDAMAAGPRPADLVEAFALPLPSMVICRLLGVPYSDHDLFQRLSRRLLDTRVTAEEAERNNGELRDYLRELVAAKQADPGDDLVSRLVGRIRSGELTRDEVVGMARLLLVAGHETTANMIGLGVLTLLRHPEQAAELRETRDPAVVSAAVEELLRLLTVVHTGRRRVATEDVELAGALIRAGEGVIAAGESANRDPARFADPDRLDIHRGTNHHVAFGFGIHQCLGQPLARLELQIAYPALLRRFPDLRVAADLDDIAFRDEMVVYGVHALPVTW
ncbi:cytochrome P450 [Pseudonocardia acidicola]|uniref:Cytochrome P450 n=1 Tax=Pseudonocardia acidicola TaxID=2724939 RepID=A0ABX1S929_9PSEU|nr:cytochrome P450 [Pseudonocardia acidicola]NMH97077.1 cytochrome P450 [Pseudonocardia acidicola]